MNQAWREKYAYAFLRKPQLLALRSEPLIYFPMCDCFPRISPTHQAARFSRLCRLASWMMLLILGAWAGDALGAEEHRVVMALDGTWQIAEGPMNEPPSRFPHSVPVPGLVSLAVPAFDPPPGPPVPDRQKPAPVKDPAREAFWYRRTFHMTGPMPAVAQLKVAKAMFGTRVILNGQVLGDHAPNVVPGYFDARGALQAGENELLVRVGADRTAVPANVPSLHDLEKQRYIPGIFDSVELIFSGTPHFLHVQTVPDITAKTVRVQAVLRNDGAAATAAVSFVVREAKSGRVAGRVTQPGVAFSSGQETTVDVRIPLDGCRLWSPEDPFLYRLEVDSGADTFTTRFGMREFRFDPATRRALLNGQPYFMRGSNLTLYRFFEDADCGDLPWRVDWVRLLHQRVKDMRWNCLRYSIGLPPEAWYDVADELGILIQDEFPVWGREGLDRAELAREYAAWMRERWNHPSVVIWDAQNETITSETGAAIAAVRGLDLSNRPWDNGWGETMALTDTYEAHTYNFAGGGTLADVSRIKPVPRGGGPSAPYNGIYPVILNEYGYLWLNRDGSSSTLTSKIYRNLLRGDSTTAQRRHLYASYMAADTEYWRTSRQVAAVMQFTALGYSRADGQTSDNWLDVKTLTWEPEFQAYLRDAFAPVGLMVDFWSGQGIRGRSVRIPVRLINDLSQPWAGNVTLRVRHSGNGSLVREHKQKGRMDPYGNATVVFNLTWPEAAGDYVVEATLTGSDGEKVSSKRDVAVVDEKALGLAYGGRAFASSSRTPGEIPANVLDGDVSTLWTSGAVEPVWLVVDLGRTHPVSRVRVVWGREIAREFAINVSADGQTWVEAGTATVDGAIPTELSFPVRDARYVRFYIPKKPSAESGERRSGVSIRDLQVFE